MKTEREYLLEVSRLPPDALADAVSSADAAQARVLRIHLGEAQYNEIRRMAGQMRGAKAIAPGRNLVVLHGIMGSELTLQDAGKQRLLWVSALRLIQGQFSRLGLNGKGESVLNINASGMYMRFYGTQLVRLSQDWNVRAFFYDWRRDIRVSADRLHQTINDAFGGEAPVHLVAHSMGGLVARSYIQRHPERWSKGGRLVMLGTPNYGSFTIPRLLLGTNDVLALVNRIDFRHNISDLLNVARTFTGIYQMMPVQDKLPGMDALYRAATYSVVPVEQQLLDEAKDFQQEISGIVDPARMIYVAGYNRRTMAAITDETQLSSDDGYLFSRRGDGTVPHDLGLLPGVRTFFVDEEHSNLPGNARVQAAMNELLETGALQTEEQLYKGLSAEFANDRGIADESQSALRAGESARRSAREQQAVALRNLLVARVDPDAETVSPEEQALEDLITRHEPLPLSFGGEASQGAGAPLTNADQPMVAGSAGFAGAMGTNGMDAAPPRTHIRIRVLQASIQDVRLDAITDDIPIDAIAVGHYVGTRPNGAEKDLDRVITVAYPLSPTRPLADEDLIMTQFHDRGILRGDLGVPFYLPDPRADYGGNLIAIAGMGHTGKFGVPELTMVARELCWSLGRMGKRHLAAVLIGAGAANLSTADAIHGWLVGLNRALTASAEAGYSLQVVTLVVRSEKRVREAVLALRREAASMRGNPRYGLEIELKDLPEIAELQHASTRTEPAPTRIAIEFENGQCRYSALTDQASIAERVFEVPTNRIEDINARLLATDDPQEKYRLGKFLLDYLFPRDLRSELVGNAPIVLACNNEAARVYWELAAQPMEDEMQESLADRDYLGLARGLTRQLRTALAPPPEPPPPVGRLLRVLVVANGCAEHPLPQAQQEAQAILDLFDRVNAQNGPERIVAKALVGPANATALDLLLQINQQPPFDVLHYAGHCYYNEARPELSGFLFSGGDILSARDLDRIDRTPKFVFANACESGVLPSRPELASPDLPAAFAEAFFRKGVANFLCTAWPVGDAPARDFALELYGQLLGDNPERSVAPMHIAVREARRKIVETRSWAAYQHYGNPYFQLFRSREKSAQGQS